MKLNKFSYLVLIIGILILAGAAGFFVLRQRVLPPYVPAPVLLGEEFTLRKGERAYVQDMDVSLRVNTFLYFPCPEDSWCVWSGLAVDYDLIVDDTVYHAPMGYLSPGAPYDALVLATDYQTFATFVITAPDAR